MWAVHRGVRLRRSSVEPTGYASALRPKDIVKYTARVTPGSSVCE